MGTLLLATRVALAATFAVAAVAKLLNLDRFRAALGEFGVPGSLIGVGAVAVPVLEGAVAVGLAVDGSARYAALAAAALLLAFSAAIARANARGSRPDCNCFGQVASAPAGSRTLLRNAVLGVAALGVAIGGPGASLGDVPAVAFVAAAVALQAWFSWELFRQNGRLLERVRLLEERGAGPGDASGPQGLEIGAVAPRFELRRAGGGSGGLGDLLAPGRPVALAFSDSTCGACAELPALLARLGTVRRGELTIALLVRAHSGHEPSQAGQAGVEVLVLDDDVLFEAYRILRLPSATVIDPDGRLASVTVAGPDAIEELLATTRGRAELEVLTRP